MRKAKSRNFLLMVCGILLALLVGFVLAKTVISVVEDMKNIDPNEEIQKNIISTSSKVKLNGKGNFIDYTPKVDGTTISDFNVRLNEHGEYVYYSVTFCNMNDEDLIYKKLYMEDVSCIDEVGNDSCDNIFTNSYVRKKGKIMLPTEKVSANGCVDVVIEARYSGNTSNSVEVLIDKVALELVSEE